MAQNPLQQFFRQPKIYISLPSHGVYNNPGTFQGDIEHMPIYGMTGMDDILLKTPDALLTGESTMQVIESCCPAIKDPGDICSLDIDLIMAAIKIATYGNSLNVFHTCPNCSEENEYSINLTTVIDHYSTCKYENKLVLKDLTVMVRPLTYKQGTAFALRNFQIQKQLSQISNIENEDEKNQLMAQLLQDMTALQNDVFLEGIESVDTGSIVVNEREFIAEWLRNCDKKISDAIKAHIQKNQEVWSSPKHDVKCSECNFETSITIDLDQSSFFEAA